MTVHCGVSRRVGKESRACGNQAVVVFTAPDRAVAACAEHEEKARRWASYSGRNSVREVRIGPEQARLF